MEPDRSLILVFRVTASRQGTLLPVSGAALREDLGFRPLALSEVSREADRPALAILSDHEDLLVRAGQLASRCGILHAAGATEPSRPAVPQPGFPGDPPMEHPLVSGIILSGPRTGLEKIFEVLGASGDPDEARLARAGDRVLSEVSSPPVEAGSHRLVPGSLDRGGTPLIMGILNVTPDSFSDGGRYEEAGAAVARGLELEEAGAAIIDVGGESSRPGARPVTAEEECRRVLPVLEQLAARVEIPISIDTVKAEVARRALEAGATIINDISGLGHDPLMAPVAAAGKAILVVNHARGTPDTMQEAPAYAHPVLEVLLDLERRVMLALSAGVPRSRLLVDPGIGFGKRLQDNLALIRHLGVLRALHCPILIGLSRKSFLGKLTGRETGGRLSSTLAAEVLAALAGAEIIRTHEPAATRDALQVAQALF